MNKSQSLDKKNGRFGRELYAIKPALDIYGLIGLNAKDLKRTDGNHFWGFIQQLCHHRVILGLAKIYETEKKHRLCSVRSLIELSKRCESLNLKEAAPFFDEYGASIDQGWSEGIDKVSELRNRNQEVKSAIKRIQEARNTMIAHLQQGAKFDFHPSIAEFEDLLEFMFDLHSTINRVFLTVHAHPILEDSTVADSMIELLRTTGIVKPKTAFDD